MNLGHAQAEIGKVRRLNVALELPRQPEPQVRNLFRVARILHAKIDSYAVSPIETADDGPPQSHNSLVGLEPASFPTEQQSVGEELAARALREQKEQVIGLLEGCGLSGEIIELEAVENRLHQRSERDRQHAAFSARLLLKAVADHVFPPQSKPWIDRQGKGHDVGPEKVANRLSAFVDERLGADLGNGERRMFQADLDAVAEWVGAGPRGIRTIFAAETIYGRLISVLAHVARAHHVPSH